MSTADPNEGDSTESFVDVSECEYGQEQNPESSSQKEKSPEEADNEKWPVQAECDCEEGESWETVPEAEGPRNMNEVQSPDPAEPNQNKKCDPSSQEEDSHHPRRSPIRQQEGDEQNQTNAYEENNYSEQTCDGDLKEETREHKGLQETTTEPEPTEPEPTKPREDVTLEPEPTKPEEDGTLEPEPTKPEEDGTLEPEPTKPEEDGTREPEPTKPEEDGTREPEPTKPKGEDGTREPEPTKPEEDGTLEPEPTKPEEDGTLEPEPTKPEEDGTLEPEPTKPEEDGTLEPEPTKPEEDETLEPEPTKPEEDGTREPEPTKPKGEDGTREPEPAKPKGEDGTREPEPTKPKGEDGTLKPEPTKPKGEDGTREPEPTKPEGEDGTREPEPTKPEGEDETKTTDVSEPSKPKETQGTVAEPQPDDPHNEESQPAEQESSKLKHGENAQLDEDDERSPIHDGKSVRCQESTGGPKEYNKENSGKESQNEGDQDEPEESKRDHCEEATTAHHLESLRKEETSYKHLAPAESPWTAHRNSAVTLRMEGSGTASIPPLTVPEFFSQAVMEFGQQTALCVWTGDGWEKMTYLQYEKQCWMVARGLLRLGLARFCGVLILGQSSPQWFIAQIGSIMAGGVAVGVDPSCTGLFCLSAALDSQAQVVMVQNGQQLQKILEVRERLSGLKAIVQWEGPVEESHPMIYTWEQLMDLGSEAEESHLYQVICQQRSNQCCAVVYESAVEPKGVLLSHDNVTWTCWAMAKSLGLGSEERVVSYLPLSHMTVQMFDLWLPLCCGGQTYFTGAKDPKVSLLSTLKAVHPTYFLGFPKFWEKVRRKWMLAARKVNPLQKKILRWAREKGLQASRRLGPQPWGYSLAERLIFHPAHQALGLDRCVRCYMGTEPVTQEVVEYYRSLGMELLEVYGMNETSGVHSLALPGRTSEELSGCRSHVLPTGEWRVWGRHICMGYTGNEERTRGVMDEEDWFITEDLEREGGGTGREKTRRREDVGLYMEL
ncbi:long-chain-fatty-acid--CoA ligase ACSBG1-like [Rana temporaria]|uniref:long-chain-fatty-acid--CoA ligase ACSBG1-like n=1 Tax=Rana temporaria TaxID=8407 RepID=UPI001AAD1DE2|nr:long-chain-fatty-acid--CoA ligase ACSBG1-like [Rana temporaria]